MKQISFHNDDDNSWKKQLRNGYGIKPRDKIVSKDHDQAVTMDGVAKSRK